MATSPGSSAAARGVLARLSEQMQHHAPFAQMEPAAVERFIAASSQAYYAPGETLLSPADGPPEALICVRTGSVASPCASEDGTETGLEYGRRREAQAGLAAPRA
jgi:CBS domain-containing protein